jgi:hypothetical protein
MPEQAVPEVPYWHIYTDADGVSRQTLCSLTGFRLKGMSGAAPQWQNEIGTETSTVNVSVMPIGWVGDWHENPKPQWIVPLSGRWFVESMDGHRVEMGPGDFSFGQDQGCTPNAQGHKGHRSGTVGDAACVVMIVQLLESAGPSGPCGYR